MVSCIPIELIEYSPIQQLHIEAAETASVLTHSQRSKTVVEQGELTLIFQYKIVTIKQTNPIRNSFHSISFNTKKQVSIADHL